MSFWSYTSEFRLQNQNEDIATYYDFVGYPNVNNTITYNTLHGIPPEQNILLYQNAEVKLYSGLRMTDISHSELTPTAKEFTPSSSRNTDDNRNQGAIKKYSSKNKYGSKHMNYDPCNNFVRKHQSENGFGKDGRYLNASSPSCADTSTRGNGVANSRDGFSKNGIPKRYSQRNSRTSHRPNEQSHDDDYSNRQNEVVCYKVRKEFNKYNRSRNGIEFINDPVNNLELNPKEGQNRGVCYSENIAFSNSLYQSEKEFGISGYCTRKNMSQEKRFPSKNYRNSNSVPWNSSRSHHYKHSSRKYNGERTTNENRREQKTMVNWRQQHQGNEPMTFEKDRPEGIEYFSKKLNAESRRELLEQMIRRKTVECLVCCEKLRYHDKIWNCKQCYHILHLKCVRQWADSSKLDNGWRCPACQNVCTDIPNEYRCYCSKQREPMFEPGMLPHSCGEPCGRPGRFCHHKCTLMCHPGPCPDCNTMVSRKCGCGSTEFTVICSSEVILVCKGNCNKLLECGVHHCPLNCHGGECAPCKEFLKQECFCGNVGRKVPCSAEHRGATRYECGEICRKTLLCGNHKCERFCHDELCATCPLSPNLIKFCPCGKTLLTEVRYSCLDPISCCEKICQKRLKCGQPGCSHLCGSPCHIGTCPQCPRTTLIKCRCGHMDKEIACVSLTTKADDARCEKKCTKKRSCGKHKCNQRCCIDIEHTCPLPCNRQLSCGLHRCPLTCHSGKCPPCLETSFEELQCECGASVIYPPISCGTRPPKCNQPCSRPRLCGHDVNHNCHTGPCPPCTVLCKRWCLGHHEQRAAIPCHQENFSCGLPCGQDLLCGQHKCIHLCHAGDCPSVCKQLCTELRTSCEHICGAPCHEPPCPDTPCKHMVKVTCQCGLRISSRPCIELTSEYQRIEMANLVSKMAEMQKGYTVDISDIVSNQRKPVGSLKTLECTEECRVVERNRRLAIGLQIRNPDLSAKLTPRYSEYMRGWARKDPRFCQRVHDKLTELVQLAKQSKQKTRSYSFESMNRDKRHFVHEYCEHFGCESAAYDQEPNRNIVATAVRDKSWLPSVSLLELIQREKGQRKVPGPVLSKGSSSSKGESVSFKLRSRLLRPATPPGEYVDYFNGSPQQ